ncbi:MAG: lipopolysaccharide biosynthesis protein [Marinobacter sp.]|nr:lipopolysaccharide biosynthesis protein [Marinobacter sp.]
MANIRQALIYSSASRYIMRAIGLVTTMVIARLLSPDEIGTFAIASAIVMIMSEFRLLGAGAWLIRENEIPKEKIRRALGLTVLISWGMGGSLLLLAPVISGFYDIPSLSTVFQILSVSFFLAPYISIPTSLLSREYEFKRLFYIRLACTLSGLLCTILLILKGYSYYALAWGYTVNVLVEFVMISIMRPKNSLWIPAFSNLKEVASFGVFNSISNLLKRATVSIPDMVIGKMGTTFQVGIFSRGLGFVEFVSQTLITGVNPVVLPYLSDIKRAGGDIKQAYLKATVLMGAMVWPVLVVISLASLPAIRIFFGDQWDAAAPIATWLAIWAMLRSVHWFSNDLFMAAGHEKIMAFKEVVVFLFILIALLFLFPYGLAIVSLGFVLAGLFEFIITTAILNRVFGLGFFEVFRSWLSNIYITAICGLSAFFLLSFYDTESFGFFIPVVMISIVLPPIWFACLFVFKSPLSIEVMKVLRAISERWKPGI